jgi:GTPase SAR1 family protein
MEYLVDNMEWLCDKVDSFADDYLIFDIPGQIELFTHVPTMRRVVDALQQWGYNVCAVYLLDSLFVTDASRFISGSLSCLSAMMQLELPHINVLSKCDMLPDRSRLDAFLDATPQMIVDELNQVRQYSFSIAELLSTKADGCRARVVAG